MYLEANYEITLMKHNYIQIIINILIEVFIFFIQKN